MELTEDKIRQIVAEAQKQLGPQANPTMIRKVVREVIRRLAEDAEKSLPSTKY
ncbi:MAG TPA: hypothetical protein VGA99_03895 [bacterium]